MTDVPFPLAQTALMAHLDRHAAGRTLTVIVADVRRAQAALMNAPPSSRTAKVLRTRLERLALELSTRTGGTLTVGPL